MTAERAQLGAEADRESAAADTLSDLADRLPADPATDSVHEAFGGDLAAARTEVGATARDLDEATAALTTVTAVRAGLALEALHLAASPLYRELSLSLRERLSEGDAAVLGAKAGDYVDEVELRLAQIAALFEQVRADEEHVTTVVGGHVRKLLTAIAGAARASRLPAGLGELSGQQFLNLRFANPSEDELTSRVGQEILSALETAHGDLKSLPSGESLLRRCVHAAVGVKGFRAEVLKPNEHMLEHRVPVTDVARFSDGEKLTTCVLLFCAFARMRRRGAVTGGGATGTLMLDNPFGKASTAQLVALQLAVAKAQQVHLVYATGLEDMGALVQFRRISRLRNRKPVGTTDGHVQHEADTGRRGEVTGVSVARPDAPSPVVPAATASARTHDDENLDLHPEA